MKVLLMVVLLLAGCDIEVYCEDANYQEEQPEVKDERS